MNTSVERLAELVKAAGVAARAAGRCGWCDARVELGRVWARVDVDNSRDGAGHWSGRYMVRLETGEIHGIKAYGVPHLGRRYGTLATLDAWDWETGRQAKGAA